MPVMTWAATSPQVSRQEVTTASMKNIAIKLMFATLMRQSAAQAVRLGASIQEVKDQLKEELHTVKATVESVTMRLEKVEAYVAMDMDHRARISREEEATNLTGVSAEMERRVNELTTKFEQRMVNEIGKWESIVRQLLVVQAAAMAPTPEAKEATERAIEEIWNGATEQITKLSASTGAEQGKSVA